MGGNKAGRRHSDRLKRIRKDNKRIAAKHIAEAGKTAPMKVKPAEKK